jgi:hypothetical protein
MFFTFVYLYYKERRQLKTFLTKFGSAYPSRRTHLSGCVMTKKGNDYKNRILRSISAKYIIFFTLPVSTHHAYPLLAPPAKFFLCAHVARERAALLDALEVAMAARHASRIPSRPMWTTLALMLAGARMSASRARRYEAPMAATDSRGCWLEIARLPTE